MSGELQLVAVAHAQTNFDVHGYVEPCTLANVEETHLECALCSVSPSAPNACAERYASQGFEQRCRTHGGHDWKEVWCVDLRKKRHEQTNLVIAALIAAAAGGAAFVYFQRARRKRA